MQQNSDAMIYLTGPSCMQKFKLMTLLLCLEIHPNNFHPSRLSCMCMYLTLTKLLKKQLKQVARLYKNRNKEAMTRIGEQPLKILQVICGLLELNFES